jgi:ABC-2 type transport system permease protein
MTMATRRYLTAARYALLAQARNRLALGLLIAFVPLWYAIGYAIATDDAIDFRFRATGVFLHVNSRHLILITQGLTAITLIVGFMLFVAVRKNTAFDHRLVLCGYPQVTLILAKLTVLVVVALLVASYASVVLLCFWRPDHLPLVWLGFFGAALTYGGLGLLLGVLVRSELEGFFVIIMVSLIDTEIQNPLGNPVANTNVVAALPAHGPMQIAVAGGFTHEIPWRYILLPIGWVALLVILGLAIFTARTRAWNVHTIPAADRTASTRDEPPARAYDAEKREGSQRERRA